MTAEPTLDLDDLREAHAAIKPGDWVLDDCEDDLQIWRESALERVTRDETGEINGYSTPSSYQAVDLIARWDVETWNEGESATDDEFRRVARFLVAAYNQMPALLAEVKRLRGCTDPIECGHEAALGQAQAEVERLNGVVQFLGSHLQRDSLDIVDELRRQAAQEPLLPIEDVERFLKRERDNYEARSGPWRDIDDVLDAFRLHMVTGTPLTSPRPTDGPEAPGVGPKPLTEAEELRAERDALRLKVGEYENTINSFTTCTECAGHLDREHTAEWRAAQAETERDRLRHALERAALSVEHDYDSSACLQRDAHQESLRPCQQRPAEHAEDCTACDVAAALNPEQVQP